MSAGRVVYRCVGGPLDGQLVSPEEAISLNPRNWIYEFHPRRPLVLVARHLQLVEVRARRRMERLGFPPRACC